MKTFTPQATSFAVIMKITEIILTLVTSSLEGRPNSKIQMSIPTNISHPIFIFTRINGRPTCTAITIK